MAGSIRDEYHVGQLFTVAPVGFGIYQGGPCKGISPDIPVALTLEQTARGGYTHMPLRKELK